MFSSSLSCTGQILLVAQISAEPGRSASSGVRRRGGGGGDDEGALVNRLREEESSSNLGVDVRSAVQSPARAATLQRYLPSMISACTGPRDGPAPLFLRYLPVSLNFSTTRRNLVEVAPKVEIQALLAPKKPKRPFGPQKGTLSIPSFTSYPPAVASTRHHARVQESPQGAPPPPCSPRGFAALKSAFRTPPAGPLIFTGSGRSPAP